MTETFLCTRADLDATGGKEVIIERDGKRLSLMVVKHGDGVLAYVNSCPHARMPMNWKPDQFFDREKLHLFCSNHVAYFDVATGACFRGPAKGKSLTPVPVTLDGDRILTTSAEL